MADIESLFSQANQAQQGVNSALQASTKLPDMLRQAVSERFKDTGLVEARSGAAGTLMTSDANKRAELTNLGQTGQAILSPNQQNAILASTRAAALTPLMTLNDMYNQRTGTTEQAIQGGLYANDKNIQAQQTAADALYRQAQDTWSRDMQERQFAASQAKESGNDFWDMLSTMSEQQPVEEEAYPGFKGKMKSAIPIGTLSKKGQWTFNGQDWEPVQQSTGGLSSLLTPEVLMAGVASGKLSSTDANFLMSASGLKQTSAQQKQETINKEKQYSLSQIDRLTDLMNSGIKTGPIQGRTLQWRGKNNPGGMTSQEREAYNLIGKIGAKQLFELGGKTLPAQEMARLDPFALSYSTGTETNLESLSQLRKELEAIYSEALNSDWELVE